VAPSNLSSNQIALWLMRRGTIPTIAHPLGARVLAIILSHASNLGGTACNTQGDHVWCRDAGGLPRSPDCVWGVVQAVVDKQTKFFCF
jgi:hypothetical protein